MSRTIKNVLNDLKMQKSFIDSLKKKQIELEKYGNVNYLYGKADGIEYAIALIELILEDANELE